MPSGRGGGRGTGGRGGSARPAVLRGKGKEREEKKEEGKKKKKKESKPTGGGSYYGWIERSRGLSAIAPFAKMKLPTELGRPTIEIAQQYLFWHLLGTTEIQTGLQMYNHVMYNTGELWARLRGSMSVAQTYTLLERSAYLVIADVVDRVYVVGDITGVAAAVLSITGVEPVMARFIVHVDGAGHGATHNAKIADMKFCQMMNQRILRTRSRPLTCSVLDALKKEKEAKEQKQMGPAPPPVGDDSGGARVMLHSLHWDRDFSSESLSYYIGRCLERVADRHVAVAVFNLPFRLTGALDRFLSAMYRPTLTHQRQTIELQPVSNEDGGWSILYKYSLGKSADAQKEKEKEKDREVHEITASIVIQNGLDITLLYVVFNAGWDRRLMDHEKQQPRQPRSRDSPPIADLIRLTLPFWMSTSVESMPAPAIYNFDEQKIVNIHNPRFTASPSPPPPPPARVDIEEKKAGPPPPFLPSLSAMKEAYEEKEVKASSSSDGEGKKSTGSFSDVRRWSAQDELLVTNQLAFKQHGLAPGLRQLLAQHFQEPYLPWYSDWSGYIARLSYTNADNVNVDMMNCVHMPFDNACFVELNAVDPVSSFALSRGCRYITLCFRKTPTGLPTTREKYKQALSELYLRTDFLGERRDMHIAPLITHDTRLDADNAVEPVSDLTEEVTVAALQGCIDYFESTGRTLGMHYYVHLSWDHDYDPPFFQNLRRVTDMLRDRTGQHSVLAFVIKFPRHLQELRARHKQKPWGRPDDAEDADLASLRANQIENWRMFKEHFLRNETYAKAGEKKQEKEKEKEEETTDGMARPRQMMVAHEFGSMLVILCVSHFPWDACLRNYRPPPRSRDLRPFTEEELTAMRFSFCLREAFFAKGRMNRCLSALNGFTEESLSLVSADFPLEQPLWLLDAEGKQRPLSAKVAAKMAADRVEDAMVAGRDAWVDRDAQRPQMQKGFERELAKFILQENRNAQRYLPGAASRSRTLMRQYQREQQRKQREVTRQWQQQQQQQQQQQAPPRPF